MRRRILLLYTLTMIAILGLVSFMMQWMGSSIVERQTTLRLSSLAASKATQIFNLVEQDFERVSLIASRTQMRDSLRMYEKEMETQEAESAKMREIVVDAAHSVEAIRSVEIANLIGQVVASTEANNPTDPPIKGNEWFIHGKEGYYFSDIQLDAKQRPYYHLAMPLFHTGEIEGMPPAVIGVLRVEMALDRMISILGDTTGLGNTGNVTLLSLEAENIRCLSPLGQCECAFHIQQMGMQEELNQGEDVNQWVYHALGHQVLASYHPIHLPDKQWGVLVTMDKEEVMGPYVNMYGYVVVMILCLMAMGNIIMILGTRYSFRGIEELLAGAEEYGKGHLNHRIQVKTKDEIGKLANSYNIMAGKLKTLQDKMENLSVTDQLTGIGNRRLYEEELLRLDTPRYLPLSVMMGDVNGLKLVNDAFGHAQGDKLLKRVATVLLEGCHTSHVICRVGGDEFVVLMPETERADVEERLQGIKCELSQQKVGRVEVSVSFGVATKYTVKEPILEVMQQAEEAMYAVKLQESKNMKETTVQTIIDTFFASSKPYLPHGEKVSEWCGKMAKQLAFSEEKRNRLMLAGKLHDLGKITFDETLLHKPTSLTKKEWMEIKRHPENGYRILESISGYKEIAEIILSHHERWDGSGYPRNLKGKEIPIESRIIAIAESYDVMTNTQPYQAAMTRTEALEELQKNAGSKFDPALVALFINLPE